MKAQMRTLLILIAGLATTLTALPAAAKDIIGDPMPVANQNGKLDAAEYRKISRMGGHAEQHFNGVDKDKDGFLAIAEFTTHAESKLATVEQPKAVEKLQKSKR